MSIKKNLNSIAKDYLQVSENTLLKAQKIQLLLLDVDGVLSDGRITFDNQSGETKSFNTKDGQGLKLLRESGVEVGIITGRKSEIVERRAQELGIERLIQGREDKFIAMQELLEGDTFALENIAFMGDDYPDLTVMSKVGLSFSINDAHFAVRHYADWVSPSNGGHGAVRDACDLIMLSQDKLIPAFEKYI